MKKDLAHMESHDREGSYDRNRGRSRSRYEERKREREIVHSISRSSTPDLLSEDMRRERERARWEREADEELEVGPIHYQSVQQKGMHYR